MNPLLDRIGQLDRAIVALTERQSRLERSKDAIIRRGTVIEIAADGKRVRCKAGQLTTPWIAWVADAAGEIVDYRCPSVGEGCVLLNYSGGEHPHMCVALCGVPTDKYPLPVVVNTLQRLTQYPSGVSVLVDPIASKVTVEAGELHGSGEVSDRKRTMTGDRAIYDDHIHPTPAGPSDKPLALQG